MLDYTKITNPQFEDIDYKDAPDFSDAHISSADYDGRPMTEHELDELNEDSDYVHEKAMDYIY